jgi:hypothetical protein
MKTSVILSGFLSAACLAVLWGVIAQRRQLAELRLEREQLSARLAAETNLPSPPTPAAKVSTGSLEVLRLRSEVTQLGQRKQALAGVTNENRLLRAQLESARSNQATANSVLPPDYVRKSQAQFMGYSTPENTMQSMLWAINNHDFTNLLLAFAPELQQEFQARLSQTNQPIEELWQEAESMPGFRVAGREAGADGSVILKLEMAPGTQAMPMRFRAYGGLWKVDQN